MTISCGHCLEVEENGLPRRDQFNAITFGKDFSSTLSIMGQMGAILAQIPIAYSFVISPVKLLSTNSDFETIATLAGLTSIEFGKVVSSVNLFSLFSIHCQPYLGIGNWRCSVFYGLQPKWVSGSM